MHTLVTGGAGFIGSSLVDRLLAEGHTVDVVDNLSSGSLWNLADARAGAGRNLSFHQLDVRSHDVADLIVRRKPEVVWHLAAQTDLAAGLVSPASEADVDVVGALGILEGVRSAGARKLVVTSSAAVYGELHGGRPAAESHPRRPLSPHGIAKHTVDAYLAAFAELEGVVFTSLVLGTVYGPRASSGVVAAWASCLAAGRPCAVFGDGRQVRDFVYIDDVVDALARAADRADGMVLNVGTGRGTSLLELHALMVEQAGRLAAERGSTLPDAGDPAGEDSGATDVGVPAVDGADAAVDPGKDDPEGASTAVGKESGDPERGAAGDVLRRGPALGLRHAPAVPAEPRAVVLDPARAATALDWAPWTDLADGVQPVITAAFDRDPAGR
jgi:UDP-glucose 4-epimerase